MKRIIVLGATGSIGRSACDVVRAHPDEFRVVAVAARSNREGVESLALEFGARAYCGENSASRAVMENEADLVLVATVGLSGLAPTLAAIGRGMDVALATKETLVAAGALVTERARAAGVRLIPVDSEHSAIFQCLYGGEELAAAGERPQIIATHVAGRVAKLTLTASGGPFLDGPADLSSVTPEQALRHPSWKMGPKVTIDSATMMNKGFEVMEARWLFDVPVERIEVVVHPESVVHSMVEFTDGSTLAQLSPPDMRLPIQYALSWPRRLPASRRTLDLPALGRLNFRSCDRSRFPCLELAASACAAGGAKCAALSGADEVAVARFLAREIAFTDISRIVSRAVDAASTEACDTPEAVYAADAAARSLAMNCSF